MERIGRMDLTKFYELNQQKDPCTETAVWFCKGGNIAELAVNQKMTKFVDACIIKMLKIEFEVQCSVIVQ